MRRIIALATALGLVLSVLLAVASVTQANASASPDGDGGPCVPEPAHWSDWTDNGGQVRTDDNVAPGPDTDTERWLFVGETAPEVITPATLGQHYSLTGNSGLGKDETPLPPSLADYRQANTQQEPHGSDNVTWLNGVGSGLHFTSHGPYGDGNRDWFYYEPGTPAVTDTDFLWQKQVRAWIPATECPPNDIAVTPNATGVPDDCDADVFGTITVDAMEGVTYTLQDGTEITGTIAANGTNTVTAHLAEGYVLAEGAQDSWTFTSNPATDCPSNDIAVTPNATGVPDDCDADLFGTITVDAMEGVTYTLQDGTEITGTIAANGTNTVTAHLAEGYVLAEGAQDSWTFTSNPATDCPPDVTPFPAQFSAEPAPPTCETDGALPSLTEIQAAFPNVTFSISPAFTGPGQYTVTVTPNAGFAFNPANVPAAWTLNPNGSASRVITVAGALGFQSSDPEAACYLAPPEDCVNTPSPETCPAPEGTRSEETTEECVNGDLVTTHSVSGTEPVWNEVNREWDLVPFDESSQTVKQNAKKCATPPLGPNGPNGPNNPEGPDGSDGSSTPSVPTAIDAGLTSVGPESEWSFNYGLLTGAGFALLFSMLGVARLVRGTGRAAHVGMHRGTAN